MAYIDPATKLFYHSKHIDAIRDGQLLPPVNVEVDLSNRCSLGCSWCHFAYTHTRGPLAGKREKPEGAVLGGDLMSLDLAKSMLLQFAEFGVKSVTWTGGGEPTLHPNFSEIIDFAFDLGIEQGLYTHGGHVSPELAKLLKQKLKWVYVSLDEVDPYSYKQSKGVSGYDRAFLGIANLVAAEGPATIGIGYLIHTGNVYDIDRMVGLGLNLKVDYVQFRPTILYSQAAPNKVDGDTAWVDLAVRNLKKWENNKFVICDVGRFNDYKNWGGHTYANCYWSALQTVVTPNGLVWRCVNKREHPDAILGDLNNESFANIWSRIGGACAVDSDCRVMCRGHVANVALDKAMNPPAHVNFI